MNNNNNSRADKIRVLLLDNDSPYRKKAIVFLTQGSYQIKTHENSDLALKEFQESRPHVIIAGSEVSGTISIEDFIHHIKAKEPNFPFILITSIHVDFKILNLLRYPRFVAIQKTETFSRLEEAIHHVLTSPPKFNGPERRKAFRLDTSLTAAVEKHGNGTVKNISLHGLFIELDHTVPIGSQILLTLKPAQSNSNEICLQGVVMWVKELNLPPQTCAGIGIQFTQISHEMELVLRKYIIGELAKRSTEGCYIAG